MTLLSTRGLNKHYAGLTAVNQVDFELPQGQIRALIGPNGAGKSTFVGLLSGRITASSGTVAFKNKNITALPAHRRIALGMAYTFQITSIFSNLPVHENVALAARRTSQSTHQKTVDQKVFEVLDRMNLSDRSDQIAGDLSYGHQRLVEIAMGLVQSPELFILDEPTQGLSTKEIESFIQLIKSLSGSTTILLIEHNMEVVMATADYITVLDSGAILAEGTPVDIRADPAVQTAYLGSANA